MNMTLSKNEFLIFVIFMIIVLIGFFNSQSFFSPLLSVLVYFYIGFITQQRSSIHMMFFLGYSSFIFLPSLLNWYYLDIDFSFYFLTSLVSAVFLYLTRGTLVKPFMDYGAQPRFVFIFISILMISLSLLKLEVVIVPLFAFFIFLLSLCFKQNHIKNNFIYLFIFSLVFFIYSFFSWSGYGRTVVVGWLLLANLQFAYSIDFKVNKYAFGLVPGLAATLLSDRSLLKLKFSGFESALYDSAYQPYRLASSFIDEFNISGFDFSGFFDQILFTFFVFIPRDLWVNKPNGFGFEYTVRHFDQSLIDAGHSIASTLIGDHIYFLGYLGTISSIIVLSLIAYAINFFYKIKGLNGNGVVVFSSSMMVLVWGGMTSFSARIALPGMVFIIVLLLFRRVLTGELKIKLKSK